MNLYGNHLISLTYFAIFLTIAATYIDLNNWLFNKSIMEDGLSQCFRFGRTVLITYLVWLSSEKKLGLRSNLLLLAFIICSIADAFLILLHRLDIGILFFTLMQIVLIVRHAPDLNSLSKNKGEAIMAFVAAICFYLIFLVLLFWFMPQNQLMIHVIVYGFLLVMSCLFGYFSRFKNDHITRIQSSFIFWGMILFLLCDITVLLPVMFPNQDFAQIVRAFTGVFYTPSLLLLAWSGVKNESL